MEKYSIKKEVAEISQKFFYNMQKAGYSVRVVEDVHGMAFRTIVEPNLEAARNPPYYYSHSIAWEDCSWHASWWARLVRWMITVHTFQPVQMRLRLLMRRIIPRWLTWLCYAKCPILNTKVCSLPADVLDRVRAQRYEMYSRGENPTMIACGQRAFHRMYAHPDLMDRYRDISPEPTSELMGLKLRISPWLEEDAVVVI